MAEVSKIGILEYIAQSAVKGVKFKDEPNTWYNPTNDAKDQVKAEYLGKEVEVMLVKGKKTEFSSMVLLEKNKVDDTKNAVSKVAKKIIQEEIEEGYEDCPDCGAILPECVCDEITTEPKEPEPKADVVKGVLIKEKITTLNPCLIQYTQEAYSEMEKTKLETAKKGKLNLTYASWAEAWGALKRIHPTSTYHVHEDKDTGMPYINDENLGAFVKVSVTVLGITHTVHLPVMNNSYVAAMKTELSVVLINKNIQRCFAKAIAMHGLGLYVFKGEDLPSD